MTDDNNNNNNNHNNNNNNNNNVIAMLSNVLALRYQQESDCFKRALKTHLFLSINELNTSVVFFYFHLPTIDTTLVITNLTHLSYY